MKSGNSIESKLKTSVFGMIIMSFIIINFLGVVVFFSFVCELSIKAKVFLIVAEMFIVVIHFIWGMHLNKCIEKKQYTVQEVYVKKKETLFLDPSPLFHRIGSSTQIRKGHILQICILMRKQLVVKECTVLLLNEWSTI